jgi:hypothetical protein
MCKRRGGICRRFGTLPESLLEFFRTGRELM